MNESETRAEYIDPKLKESGWGVIEDSKILREYRITDGRLQTGGKRADAEFADYILVYKNIKIAVIEAKKLDLNITEGVAQAKAYAEKLQIEYTYSTNGKEIYEMSLKSGKEWYLERFPTPQELWNATFSDQNEWKTKFDSISFEDVNGTRKARYYQELAVNKTMSAIAEDKNRILLTLATGTGKTFVSFQIAWKLFHARWNLNKDGLRRPRILFLADRNILADQAKSSFSAFSEDALVRINPEDIKKKGSVPMGGSIFFTIFQTFMSGETPHFGEYPKDFFDLIIIDECHRGGANDEGNWRGILEYFSPAVQLGLTATPKRKDNIDTYKYFGDPVYSYSLKEGINDGFLTPFKIKRIKTTLDDYVFTLDDEIIEGDIEEGKVYKEPEFNRSIEIIEREKKRVKIMLDEINQDEKTIIFCATQEHAGLIRDLINQNKKNSNPLYCVRVTANDGAKGEQFLRDFQDNEKSIPTILTTSQKLSTGVDARNVRNIVLMRPVNSMIEFKQIIGRGTRLFDGKEFFTIYDFVDAYQHFSDPEWDGEPASITETTEEEEKEKLEQKPDKIVEAKNEISLKLNKIKIKLRDGKEREIQHMISVFFYSGEGKPISVQEFMDNMFGEMPEYFKSEEELIKIWSNPITRKVFLTKIISKGYSEEQLDNLQNILDTKDCDLFDVLSYVSFMKKPITRKNRVDKAKNKIYPNLRDNEKDFFDFITGKYIENGVGELTEEKLPILINMKYNSTTDAMSKLGNTEKIRNLYFDLQKQLYKSE